MISLPLKEKPKIVFFVLLFFLFVKVIFCLPVLTQESVIDNEEAPVGQDSLDIGDEPSVLKGYVSKIPIGTKLNVILETPIDEETSKVDDEITAKTSEDVAIDGNIVVPADSTVVGEISEINPAKRFHRAGNVRIEFKSLTLTDGRQVPIVASVLTRSGLIKGKYTKKTALISGATIVTPAAAGFGAGIAAEGSPLGGAIGAALGLLAGVALFAFQRGNMVDIKAGNEFEIELIEEALLPEPDHQKIIKLEEDLNRLEIETEKIESFETKPVELDFTEEEKSDIPVNTNENTDTGESSQ